MECLQNLIGLRGCGAATPVSTLFVNDLEGISMGSLQDATTAERKTFLQVWEACEKRALSRIAVELPRAFVKRYQFKRLIRKTNLQRRLLSTTIPATNKFRGFTVQLSSVSGLFVPSLFQVVYFSDFSLYSPAAIAGNVTVKLFDLETQEELDTFTVVNPAQGWNRVAVEKSYPTYRFALAYDATLVTGTDQPVPSSVVDGWISCTSMIYGSTLCGYIRGFESQDLTGAAVWTEPNNMFGLTATFSYQCRLDSLVCDNKMLFSYPLLYCLGAELMYSLRHTESLSRFNTVDAEEADQLISDYNAEFVKSLQDVADGIELDTSDACIECNAQYQTQEALP